MHGVPITPDANSTLQESFVGLWPFASFYFIMFASERQNSRVKKAEDPVALDAVEYICCNGPHAESPIPAHSKKSQPPGRPCWPRSNSEANTSWEIQPHGWQPCPSHRAEVTLKSQWKGKGLSTDHFPSRCLLSVAWHSLRAVIWDSMSLQSNVEVPAQCLEKGRQPFLYQDYHAPPILLLGISFTCLSYTWPACFFSDFLP